jgi:hypothetical protein
VFDAFGVIPQFPAIADTAGEDRDLQRNCTKPTIRSGGPRSAAECKVPRDLTLTRRILWESNFGSPQEVSEKS